MRVMDNRAGGNKGGRKKSEVETEGWNMKGPPLISQGRKQGPGLQTKKKGAVEKKTM